MTRTSIGGRQVVVAGLLVLLLIGFLVLRPLQEEAERSIPKPVAVSAKTGDSNAQLKAPRKPASSDNKPCQPCQHECKPNQAVILGAKAESDCCSVTCRSIGSAPSSFRVRFDTTKGPFVAEFTTSWSPLGVQRVYEMVQSGFFNDGIAFFRNVPRFIVQFGIHGHPTHSSFWRSQNINDDPVMQSNTRGTITFATAGKNTRTTQLFINFGNNHGLDGQGFSPLGRVTDGMDEVVDKLSAQHGEKPNQGLIQARGNAYLKEEFANLDYITKAVVIIE